MSEAIGKDREFLSTAMDRFDTCVDMQHEVKKAWKEDVEFTLLGEQWDNELKKSRDIEKRPSLTINRVLASTNQVVNDFRQNRPMIKVRPVDNVDDPKKSDVINGLYRRIQTLGDYKTAVDTAFQYQVVGGIGFVRIGTKYCSDTIFDQDIFIDRIENPCMVYFPIDLCQQIDYSDAPYCFVRTDISKDEYERKYPKSNVTEWIKSGEGDSNRTNEKTVMICEYFREEYKKRYLVMYDDNDIKTIEEKVSVGQVDPAGRTIVKVREVMARIIYRSLITEFEILEPETELPIPWIPIVPFLGQEVCVDGKKSYISMTKYARDPQKMFNYWNSAYTEQIALQPKAPFIAAAGQIENYKKIWSSINIKNYGVVPYDPVSSGGTLVPPPQRVAPPEAGMAIVNGIQFAADNIKATTGIYDASLGGQGNETSGRAINARLRQAGTGNYHYSDNAAKALAHIGRIIKDWIPVIYDNPERMVRIVGEDLADEVIKLSIAGTEGNAIDLTVGDYDIVVDVGPSYETKRLETSETLLQLSQSSQAVSQFAPDLLVRAIDFPLRDETAERIKRGLNLQFPGLVEQEQEKDGKVPAEQVKQIVAQSQQQIQQMEATIQEMNQVIEKMSSEIENKDKEIQAKVGIEQLKAEVEVLKAQLDYQAKIRQQNLDTVKHGSDTAIKIHAANLDAEQREIETEAEQNSAKTNTSEDSDE